MQSEQRDHTLERRGKKREERVSSAQYEQVSVLLE